MQDDLKQCRCTVNFSKSWLTHLTKSFDPPSKVGMKQTYRWEISYIC